MSRLTIARPLVLFDGIDGCASAVDPIAQVDRREQRRFSEDVPLIDIGAGDDQLLRQVPVGVHDRHEQRRDAIRIRQVDVRPVLEQHVHARHAVLTCGIEQRRQSTAVQVLGTPLGRHMTLIVAIDGARIDVGALGDQQLHHLRMPARGRPHQRGLSAPLFPRIDGGVVVQQQLCGFDVARSRDRQECRLSVGIGRVGIRADFEEQLQHVGVADFGGEAHRRGAVVVGERHVGAGLQQTPDLGDVTLVDRPLQRRAAVDIAAVDVFFPR